MNRLLLALAMVLIVLSTNSQALTEVQIFRGLDTPNGSGSPDDFGREMDISGNTAVISAPEQSGGAGAVYVFELGVNNQWTEVAKLTASDPAVGKEFGSSVAIEGDVIVVGNGSIMYANQGAYIFEKPGSGWANATETIKLNTPAAINSSSTSAFGFSVDINGPEILVGAPYEDNGGIPSGGKIYVYEKSGASWTTAFIRAELTTTNVGNGDLIGYSAVFGDNFIVSGANTGASAGTMHVFERPVSGTWANASTEDIILVGSDRSANDGFGGVTGTNGDLLVTMGALDGTVGTDMNVYFFEREGTLWSGQSTQTEAIISNMPSYFLFSGFLGSHSVFSLELQGDIVFIGNGSSTGPTSGNNAPSGSVFILNYNTANVDEIDGLQYSPNGLFGSSIAVDGSRVLISSPQETVGGVVRYYDFSYSQPAAEELCSGQSITFGTQTITSAGTYQELFTSVDGLDSLVTLTVTLSDLALATSKTDNLCFGGSDGEITLSPSGGTAPYEYSIDGTNYVTSSSFSSLSAGSYTVYTRDANGCVLNETVTIQQPSLLQVNLASSEDASCNGEASGLINVSALGGTGAIEFSVDGVNFGPSPITGLTAGTFDITARDANGCEQVILPNMVVNEPNATLPPVIAGAPVVGGTVYGTPFTGISIAPDPADPNATHFMISTQISSSGRLFKSDGVTELFVGDFITVAEGAAGLIWEPTVVGPGSFFVQSAADNRTSCVGGSATFAQVGVTKAPLTATMVDQTILYGEDPDMTVQYSGFVNGEDETDLDATITVSTLANNLSATGNYTISASGTVDTNYDITFVDGTVTIDPRPLNVTADDQSSVYGDSFPTFSGVLNGLVNNDNIAASYSTIADGSSVGNFDITATLVDPDSKLLNYTVTNTPGTLTITQASLTATANDQSITFGDALPSLDGTLSGVVNGDNITASYATTASASSGAGTYPITVSLNDPDTRLGNYSTTLTDGTLTISKADQVITFGTIADIDLATANTVSLTATADSGLPITYTLDQGDGSISGTTLTVNTTGNFTVTASQDGDDDYNAASSVSQSFQVVDSRKTDQTITFTQDLTGKTYGEAPFTLTATASSQLAVSYSSTGPVSIANGEVTILGAGEATITAEQAGDGTYNPATSVTQTFMIGQASLTATADDATITFGDALPMYTVSYAGFVGSDDASDLDTPPTATSAATSSSDAGAYAIVASGGQDDNYTFTYVDGTLTINKADQTITFGTIADIDIANTTQVTLTATADSGLPITYTLDQGDGSISGTTLTVNNTGNFMVTATQAGTTNYTAATPVSQTFAVTDSRKQDQTITFASIADQEYGEALTLNATASSNLAVSYTLVDGVGTLSNGVLTIEGVGSYELRATQDGDTDYNPAPAVTQQFMVSKAPLTATADDQTINEGDALPTLTISYTGFKLSDDATTLDTAPTVSTEATTTSGPGSYALTVTGGDDANYAFTLVDGVLTIAQVLGIGTPVVEVYPNPATDRLTIQGVSYEWLTLSDLSGREVLRTSERVLDLGDLPKAVYVLRLEMEGRTIHQQKIKIN